MAYDEGLFRRILGALADRDDTAHKKMFGGVCFLVRGNMACGIIGDDLIVRVGPDRFAEAMARPHTRIFDFTHRPMNGWVVVEPAGLAGEDALADWVAQGVAFAAGLPAKA
jgi:hypothetical protein